MAEEITQFNIWDALKAGDPTLALVPVEPPLSPLKEVYSDYPGFIPWLMSEYALGYPAGRVFRHLESVRSGQMNDGVKAWPSLSRREIDAERTHRRSDWIPVRDRLSANIENVGVLAKNERLLALARHATEVEDAMWEERNARTGELYMLTEYRETLRQIAEEKGELGEGQATADNALLMIAQTLAGIVKVQGAGVQPQIVEGEWDYAEAETEEAILRGEGLSVETGGVQAEPGADSVPQGDN
jgi:hypothetical protein